MFDVKVRINLGKAIGKNVPKVLHRGTVSHGLKLEKIAGQNLPSLGVTSGDGAELGCTCHAKINRLYREI